MDYGPTIAAAFASPNEREVYNLRTVFTELMKRANQARVSSAKQAMSVRQDQYNATGRDHYGRNAAQSKEQAIEHDCFFVFDIFQLLIISFLCRPTAIPISI